jgi:hypothetical protein
MNVASAFDVLFPARQVTFGENLTDGLNVLCQPDSLILPIDNNIGTWL